MSSGFNVIRRHSSNEAGVRIKELTQELARQRSQLSSSALETDDVRSEGRMDHSTIKLNDERLKFATTLDSANTDFFYEFPNEPDFNFLKVWFMLDHLGTRIRDMSGFGNDGIVAGHPTLRRAGLDLGFQQTGAAAATPVMIFNSGTDVVSQSDGEYIWIPDNPSIQFTLFPVGFSIAFRFNCLNFNSHESTVIDFTASRRFASKTDNATNGWNLLVYPTNTAGTQGGVEFEIMHNGVGYARRTTGYTADTWYQVVLTYDPNQALAANRIKIYTAGIENSVSSTFDTILNNFTNLRIGARSAETGFFHGYIHDFRMYMGKVLTQTEITNLNQNELTIDNIVKGHSFVIQYALVSQVLKSRTHIYRIGGYIVKDRTHKYNIIRKITRTKTHKWNTVNKITRTRTHKFNIVKQVSRTRTHKFSMGGHLTLTKTHKFNITAKLTTTRTHKYHIGLQLTTQYQRFQKSTGASGSTQQVSFTNTPQALIVWTDGSTADNTYSDHYVLSYGFSDGTNQACITGMALDAAANADTFSGYKTDKVIAFPSSAGVVAFEATVSFSPANNATFTWTTNDASARYIHCMAIWGASSVEVKNFTTGQATTGTRADSFNNSSLTPRFIHAICRDSAPASWSTLFGNTITIGAGVSSSKQFSVANMSVDASLSIDTKTAYSTTNTIIAHDEDTGNIQTSAAAYSSAAPGSITLNWTDAPASTTDSFSILAIDSTGIDVGIITQPNNVTGSQVTNTDTNVGLVRGLMIFSNSQSSGTLTDNSALTVGAASGTGSTAQGLISISDPDNVGTSTSVRVQRTGAITRTFSANATSASSTTTTEASVSNLGTNQFTLNWTTIDANTRKYHYIAFG